MCESGNGVFANRQSGHTVTQSFTSELIGERRGRRAAPTFDNIGDSEISQLIDYAAKSLSNSPGSSVLPSLSVMTTCHPSLIQTRALAIAISTLIRSHLTVSFSLVATI